jgi:hypothetical protein
MTPTEALGVGIGQTAAGNLAAQSAQQGGHLISGGEAIAMQQTSSAVTNVGGSLAAGTMLPNGLDNLMPERMAANTVRTVYQGASAALSGEEGAISEFAESVRDRPGFDPFAGIARAADELGRVAAGEYESSASATLSDHAAVAAERADAFQQQVAEGGTTAALQGVDHIMRGLSDFVADPTDTVRDAASGAVEIANDVWNNPTAALGDTVDHLAGSSAQGDYGMIAQGYAEIGNELGQAVSDPGAYLADTGRVLSQFGSDFADWVGWGQ